MSKWQERGSSPTLPSWRRVRSAPSLTRAGSLGECRHPPPGQTQAHRTHRHTRAYPPDMHRHSDPPQSESESCSVVSDSLQHHGLYSPWNSPGQNTGVSSLSLLQRIFPTQGSNPGLPHCRQILYQLSHQGSPKKVLNSHAHTHRLTHTEKHAQRCTHTQTYAHRDTHRRIHTERHMCADICTETHTCAHPPTHTHTHTHTVACSVSHTATTTYRLTPPALNTVTQAWPTQPHHTWHPPSRVHTLPLPPPGHSTHPSPRAPRSTADSLRDMQEDVRAAVSRGDKAVALGPTEAFADSFVDWALGSPHRPDRRQGEHEGPPPAL